MINNKLLRIFPFLNWFPINFLYMRDDLIAGITGALVLVPKAMAYAQLSGLPVYFGLYTAFVPALLGILWGSSRHLATGPVAIVSLMTAAAITPLAAPLSDEFVGLALLLALMVGIIQFILGIIKLGTIVNFVSHPVILGFMNAAAIIIGLSQVELLLGIPKGQTGSFIGDIWEMLTYLPQAHLPTLLMSASALVLMLLLKKIPFLAKPSVLIVVVIATFISQAIHYEQKDKTTPGQIVTIEARELLLGYAETEHQIAALMAEIASKSTQLRGNSGQANARSAADLKYSIELLNLDLHAQKTLNKTRLKKINTLSLEQASAPKEGLVTYYATGTAPVGIETDRRTWHVKKVKEGDIYLKSGGDVVGEIPFGLPGFRIPTLSWDAIVSLQLSALIIALVAFMETISMAKAMSIKSKQIINPNQELLGQGMANIGGAFFQAYPSCGSFTGSAINLQAGAKTSFAMVFNAIFVAFTLLFLTEHLYHLPKAVLAVIILLAVTSLITPTAIKHTWHASRVDGMVAITTFVVTIFVAPHLEKGIMVGTLLSLGLFLYHSMKPRIAILGRCQDGTLRDIAFHPTLPTDDRIVAIRIDDGLFFANASRFEDALLRAVAAKPSAKFVLLVGDAINQLDASGEEVLHQLIERLNENGITFVFSGIKRQVLQVMRAAGIYDLVGGENNIFSEEDLALESIYARLGGPERSRALLDDEIPC